jgi:hypothetical protein
MVNIYIHLSLHRLHKLRWQIKCAIYKTSINLFLYIVSLKTDLSRYLRHHQRKRFVPGFDHCLLIATFLSIATVIRMNTKVCKWSIQFPVQDEAHGTDWVVWLQIRLPESSKQHGAFWLNLSALRQTRNHCLHKATAPCETGGRSTSKRNAFFYEARIFYWGEGAGSEAIQL